MTPPKSGQPIPNSGPRLKMPEQQTGLSTRTMYAATYTAGSADHSSIAGPGGDARRRCAGGRL